MLFRSSLEYYQLNTDIFVFLPLLGNGKEEAPTTVIANHILPERKENVYGSCLSAPFTSTNRQGKENTLIEVKTGSRKERVDAALFISGSFGLLYLVGSSSRYSEFQTF